MVKLLKKRMTGVLLGLLSIALVAGFTPQINAPVYAADNDPAIAPGAAVLSTGVNTENAQIFYYGNHDWYVIAYDGKDEEGIPYTYVKTDGNTANLYPEGTVTLLSKDVIGEVQFDNTWSGNAYGDANCLLKKRIDGEGGIVNDFSAGEQYAVYQRTLEGGGQNYGLGQPSSNLISGDSVTGALL
ncbi:MAG: hypothetical protein Q4A48_00025 [Bacillota bacterium]|nr:hypothetical protein [Bacillota bacterium]